MNEYKPKLTLEILEKIYERYTIKELVGTDPVMFLHEYSDKKDLEIVGLVAAALAYGRVAQIQRDVALVLNKMDGSPRKFVEAAKEEKLRKEFKGFKHRFTTGDEIAALIFAMRRAIEEFGGLEETLAAGMRDEDGDLLNGLIFFANKLRSYAKTTPSSLISDASKGSACKRLNLYLRWMVRDADVDFGCFKTIDKSKLIIPLDTHVYRFSHTYSLTARKAADLKCALEITNELRKFSPTDPVKYDFAITRLCMFDDEHKAERTKARISK